MKENSVQDQILRRLNLLVLLELERQAPGTGSTVTSKVQRLLGLGISPAEIASIFGKPVNYITAFSSSAKRVSARKAKQSV